MKYLVGTDNFVKSSSEAPLDFSTSGKIVVDVPSDLVLASLDGTLGNLVTAKNDALMASHPSMVGFFYDELLSASGVDAILSSRYLTGVRKRTAMLPSGGKILTTDLTTPVDITRVFFHCSLFNLVSEPQNAFGNSPGPSRLLYQEVPVSSSVVTVKITDFDGTTDLITVIPDSEQTLILSAPSGIRVSITNLTSGILYLGDWILLYG